MSNRVARIADEQSKERKTRLALLPVQPYSVPLPAACKRIVESQLRALRTLQAVDARCNPDHLLFATPDGRPVEANVLREHLALLERRAGVPGLTFSAIRETAIRQALADGGTDAEVMARFHCKDRQAFFAQISSEVNRTNHESKTRAFRNGKRVSLWKNLLWQSGQGRFSV